MDEEEEPAVDPLRVLVSEVKSYLLVRQQQPTVLFFFSPSDVETNICQSNTKSFERSLHETHVSAQGEAEGEGGRGGGGGGGGGLRFRSDPAELHQRGVWTRRVMAVVFLVFPVRVSLAQSEIARNRDLRTAVDRTRLGESVRIRGDV